MESVNPPHAEDAAIVALLTDCQLALRLYVRAVMPADPAAGDVIQQANAKIWEKRSDFQLGTNFKAWAMAIARYEVLNHRKRQSRDNRLRFSSELAEIVADELSAMDDDMAQRQSALQECMQRMKPESRELLLGRYASEQSLVEFARQLGRSVGGVKVTLHRLRSMLAECIERRLMAAGDSQ